jgi:serine/threonine protein kinase
LCCVERFIHRSALALSSLCPLPASFPALPSSPPLFTLQRCTQAAYRAPEMVDLYSGTPLSTALDIWALGCLFYMLLFNKSPFPTGKLAILSRKYTQVEHNYPPQIIAFMEHMLTGN